MRSACAVGFVVAICFFFASAGFAQLEPLAAGTVGASPAVVVAPSDYSLSIDGDMKLGRFLFKDGHVFIHDDGTENTAIGRDALISSTPGNPYIGSGTQNTAAGAFALQNNTSGRRNAALGAQALYTNTTGFGNVASGALALRYNETGYYNTADGFRALVNNVDGESNLASGAFAMRDNTSGHHNAAVGARALFYNTTGTRNTGAGASVLFGSTTGSRNIALGFLAGRYNTSGSSSIWIANYGADESNTLRIGEGTGTGNFEQNRAFISGIANAVGGTFDQSVCVDTTSDQLGPCAVSSARFKTDVEDLASDSEKLFALRPVKFRYTPELTGKVDTPIQYGLLAEEVAEIYPQLVTYDADGRPRTVRYDALTPLLLNELQVQRRTLENQAAELRAARAEIVELHAIKARLERQDALLRAVLARLDVVETPVGGQPAAR